jgi:hypothetical protein
MCAVYPTDDAFVDNLLPSEAMRNGAMVVQDTPTVPTSRNYAFLRFDFTGVFPSAIVQSHAIPLNATLWVYALYTNGFQNASVRAYYVPNNDWSEDSLTWNNMPHPDLGQYATQHITLNNQWYNWTVTGEVQNITRNCITSFALMAGFTSPANYATLASQGLPNAKVWPELDISFRVPTLDIQSLPNLPVMIDGRITNANSSGSVRTFLGWGLHNVSVPESVPVSEGVRMRFVRWSDALTSATRQINIGNDMTINALYGTQYRLDVISQYATTGGSGWYFQNETAVASVDSTSVPAEGLLGLVGVRHVLDHWTGICKANGGTCTLTMTGPTKVTAVWRDDYTISIVFAVAIAVVVSLTSILRHRRKRRP